MFTVLRAGPSFQDLGKKRRFYGLWLTSEGNCVVKGKKLGGGEFCSNHKECADSLSNASFRGDSKCFESVIGRFTTFQMGVLLTISQAT